MSKSDKVKVNMTISREIWEEAELENINRSQAAEDGIRTMLEMPKTLEELQQKMNYHKNKYQMYKERVDRLLESNNKPVDNDELQNNLVLEAIEVLSERALDEDGIPVKVLKYQSKKTGLSEEELVRLVKENLGIED